MVMAGGDYMLCGGLCACVLYYSSPIIPLPPNSHYHPLSSLLFPSSLVLLFDFGLRLGLVGGWTSWIEFGLLIEFGLVGFLHGLSLLWLLRSHAFLLPPPCAPSHSPCPFPG